ncbi:alpha/beta fold hydrolase [Actinocrispum sp. NPDC049592]|uniref:thioesterase II family protein n=1 Tax=Actinocrispum sp. NPDC049592 TaxID=3154835 RepID=UPI00344A2245
MRLADPWLRWFSPPSGTTPVVLCLAHAGGSASFFQNWPGHARELAVCAAQLPGRENRFLERPATSIDEVVGGLLGSMTWLGHRDYVVFGHSLGALVAFELARRLAAAGAPGPAALYVSGINAPHLPLPPPVFDLTPVDLIEYLLSLGGLDQEVLDNPALLDLLLPTLRADLQLFDGYRYQEQAPLSCPIRGLHGTSDHSVSAEGVHAWARHTTAGFAAHAFPGDHFFLVPQAEQVISWLDQDFSALRRDEGVIPRGH